MKQSIRFFSIGLLTASIILFGFYYFFNDTDISTADVAIEDMISEVESQGYRVITENEFISFTLNKEEEKTKDDKDKNKSEEKTEKKKDKKDSSKKKKNKDKDKEDDDVIKAKITTNDGVVTQEVADQLVDKKIIKEKERQKFLDYLDDNDYSPYIQVGTFKVNSDMTMKELAEVITTYPGD